MSSFWRSMKRLGRTLVSILVSGGIAYAAKDDKLILFAPLISAIGKFLRDKFNLKNIPF